MSAVLLSLLVGIAGLSGAIVPAGAVTAATGDDADADVVMTRYGGADRYATSLLIAEAVAAEAGGSLSSVVLVSGGALDGRCRRGPGGRGVGCAGADDPARRVAS